MLLRAFGARISPTASPNNRARIDLPWNLEMGAHASIGEYAWVYAIDRISIADYACVGQHVHLLAGTHDVDDPAFPLVTRPLRIGERAWIAARATVLPGAHIGAGAVIGAASVVTRPMPGDTVCAGNPCRPLRPRRTPESWAIPGPARTFSAAEPVLPA
jgi:putative colanic acid biosynthesis acetyltransferase WcaF